MVFALYLSATGENLRYSLFYERLVNGYIDLCATVDSKSSPRVSGMAT